MARSLNKLVCSCSRTACFLWLPCRCCFFTCGSHVLVRCPSAAVYLSQPRSRRKNSGSPCSATSVHTYSCCTSQQRLQKQALNAGDRDLAVPSLGLAFLTNPATSMATPGLTGDCLTLDGFAATLPGYAGLGDHLLMSQQTEQFKSLISLSI